MDVFEKLMNGDISKEKRPEMSAEDHKKLGMKREEKALNNLKKKLINPDVFLTNMLFVDSNNEMCEVDGLYIGYNTIYIVEVKSRNFDYLYGSYDIGNWFLGYKDKDGMVKSDNPNRQILRQMNILKDNLGLDGEVRGIIFLNNKNKDAYLDIRGKKRDAIDLHLSLDDIAEILNIAPPIDDPNIVQQIQEVSDNNFVLWEEKGWN